jgi:hypothetical protein
MGLATWLSPPQFAEASQLRDSAGLEPDFADTLSTPAQAGAIAMVTHSLGYIELGRAPPRAEVRPRQIARLTSEKPASALILTF